MEQYIIDNFLKRFVRGEDDECWEWTGSLFVTGYGSVRPKSGVQLLAHRVSYTYFVGEIPKGLVIDHLCENRKCVNPKHLEPTTMVDNIQRTYARGNPRPNLLRIGGTCLKRGHKIESDTDIIHSSYGNYCRKCRGLKYEKLKKWRQENRERILSYAKKYNREYYLRRKRNIV